MTNALACAEEVIHSGRFACVTDKILQDEPSKYTFVESVGRHEYITSLYVYDLKKGVQTCILKIWQLMPVLSGKNENWESLEEQDWILMYGVSDCSIFLRVPKRST